MIPKVPEALPNVGVILPAGGKGLRVGATEPKQFLPLKDQGRAMLWYSLEAFHRLDFVKSIVVVLPPDRIAEYARQMTTYPKVKLVEGGAERWESVRNGFTALDPELHYVMVHDVARPFVTETIIRRCLAATTPTTCTIAALPASDTVKQISAAAGSESGSLAISRITATLDRRQLILVQTPQVFPREILASVYDRPLAGDLPTDEAQMVERAGHEVRWVRGGASNRKITEAEDLAWANWMAGRYEVGEIFTEGAND